MWYTDLMTDEELLAQRQFLAVQLHNARITLLVNGMRCIEPPDEHRERLQKEWTNKWAKIADVLESFPGDHMYH